jgi:hypothetical protein
MIAQIVLLYGGLTGLFSDINIEWIPIFERKVIYLINNEYIFTILNIIGRDEMPEEIMSFFINMLKAYLSNEESIF